MGLPLILSAGLLLLRLKGSWALTSPARHTCREHLAVQFSVHPLCGLRGARGLGTRSPSFPLQSLCDTFTSICYTSAWVSSLRVASYPLFAMRVAVC